MKALDIDGRVYTFDDPTNLVKLVLTAVEKHQTSTVLGFAPDGKRVKEKFTGATGIEAIHALWDKVEEVKTR